MPTLVPITTEVTGRATARVTGHDGLDPCLPSPAISNKLDGLGCGLSIKRLLEQVVYEVNLYAFALGDPDLAITPDRLSFLQQKLKNRAPMLAREAGGIRSVSRLAVKAGHYQYCLPRDVGPIQHVAFVQAEAESLTEDESSESCSCQQAYYSGTRWELQRGEGAEVFTTGSAYSGTATTYGIYGQFLSLGCRPTIDGELWVFHRAANLIVEDCDCADLKPFQCTCEGGAFYGNVPRDFAEILIQMIASDWLTLKGQPAGAEKKSEAMGLLTSYARTREANEMPTLVTIGYNFL